MTKNYFTKAKDSLENLAKDGKNFVKNNSVKTLASLGIIGAGLGVFSPNYSQAQDNGDDVGKVKEVPVFSGTGKDIGKLQSYDGVKLHDTKYFLFDSENEPGFKLTPHHEDKDLIHTKTEGGKLTSIEGDLNYELDELNSNKVYLKTVKAGKSDTAVTPYAVDMGTQDTKEDNNIVSGGFSLKIAQIKDNMRKMVVKNNGERDTFYYPYNDEIDSTAVQNGEKLPMYFVKKVPGEALIGTDDGKPYLQGKVYEANVQGKLRNNKWNVDTCSNGKIIGVTYNPCYLDTNHDQILSEVESRKGNTGHSDSVATEKKGLFNGDNNFAMKVSLGAEKPFYNNVKDMDFNQGALRANLAMQFGLGTGEHGNGFYIGGYVEADNVNNTLEQEVTKTAERNKVQYTDLTRETFGTIFDNQSLYKNELIDGTYIKEIGARVSVDFHGGEAYADFGRSNARLEQTVKKDFTNEFYNDAGQLVKSDDVFTSEKYSDEGPMYSLGGGFMVNPAEIFAEKGEDNAAYNALEGLGIGISADYNMPSVEAQENTRPLDEFPDLGRSNNYLGINATIKYDIDTKK